MSVAFNDLGTLLRLRRRLPNLEGGAGTLVMRYDNDAEGRLRHVRAARTLRSSTRRTSPSIVGNHRESQEMIAANNKLEFSNGEVDFIRRKDRVEIVDGLVAGDAGRRHASRATSIPTPGSTT